MWIKVKAKELDEKIKKVYGSSAYMNIGIIDLKWDYLIIIEIDK